MNKKHFFTISNLNDNSFANKAREKTCDFSQSIKKDINFIPNPVPHISNGLNFINNELNKERTLTINLPKKFYYNFNPGITPEEEKEMNESPDFNNIKTIDYWIGKAKSNPDLWKKATLFLALGLQLVNVTTPCFGATTGLSTASSLLMRNTLGLEGACTEIIQIFSEIAKYCFLALGFKDAVVKILNGGTVKEAIQSSLQYAFGYMFLMLYPTLFNKFSKIKF